MPSTDLSESDVQELFESLSNWGRWGPEDELGTLNLITLEKRLEAAGLCREGITVGCARQILKEPMAPDVLNPPLHHMLRSGESEASLSGGRADNASDFFGIAPHGVTITHIDTLSHEFWDGRIYNDRPKELITTTEGATVCSLETMKDGVVTRGVLLDITRLKDRPWLEAGEGVFQEDLEEAERAQGVTVEEGDALLIRTGWSRRRDELGPYPDMGDRQRMPRPGLHVSALPWLRERGVAVVGADAAMEVIPSGYSSPHVPIHLIGIVAMGLHLLDACQFEDLAAACDKLDRWSFMFVVAPLRWRYGTGSPVTPIAIF